MILKNDDTEDEVEKPGKSKKSEDNKFKIIDISTKKISKIIILMMMLSVFIISILFSKIITTIEMKRQKI